MHIRDKFSDTYAEARTKFLAACTNARLQVETFTHPDQGRDGEALAMDVALLGAPDSRGLLIVSSGCHGVEGFCGAGVQVAMLHDDAWRSAAAEAKVSILYVHAINPYGFSWWRRTTEGNVDLNRNFLDFARGAPINERYAEIAQLLVPTEWPPTNEVQAALMAYIAKHGQWTFQEVVSSGQYSHPSGLFFGGTHATWSQDAVRKLLRRYGRQCAHLGWIDLHSGLGPAGHGEKIFAGRDDDPAALSRARAWWSNVVTSTYDGSSTSARISGLMLLSTYEECPQAESTAITLEYGTLPVMEILHALRSEQWLENHPDASAATRTAIKRQMRDAFYVDTDEWKQRVIDQGMDAARAALVGLSRAKDRFTQTIGGNLSAAAP